MGGVKKKRLDDLLVARGHADTHTLAAALIGAGRILVDGSPLVKAGSLYRPDCLITVRQKEPFVSRGGKKLAAALAAFALDVAGFICADIGCSTGGFTDCLLQNGARKVYAVDVGYGVLDWILRNDDRVIVLERCNARYLSDKEIPEPLDLCVADASFISLERLLGPMTKLFAPGEKIQIIVLVKPQFELPKNKVARGGIVRDSRLQQQALEKISVFGKRLGLTCRGTIPSPVKGTKGNQEYLMYLTGTAVAENSVSDT
ncbi:MAG TPA: TlyA family RNA methyltransferase [Desulfobulbaceae bacterium]|nr:TlyA family RNA methyltransferase [Desulfobulbaceae bacterium]